MTLMVWQSSSFFLFFCSHHVYTLIQSFQVVNWKNAYHFIPAYKSMNTVDKNAENIKRVIEIPEEMFDRNLVKGILTSSVPFNF